MRISLTLPNATPTNGRRARQQAPNETDTIDVMLDVDEQVTIAEVAEALAIDPHLLAPDLDPGLELATSGFRTGTALPRTIAERLPVGMLRLEFVGGPFAGEVLALPSSTSITLGRSDDMLIRLLDPTVDDHHVTFTVPSAERDPAGSQDAMRGPAPALLTPRVTVTPVSERASTMVNGKALDVSQDLGPDDLLQVGASIIRVGRQPKPDADIADDLVGTIAFNRASRIRPPAPQPTVKLPGERPTASDRAPLPWLSALIPVVIGVGSAVVFGRPFMLLMAAASPLMVIASYLTSRKLAKRSGRRTIEKWSDEVVEAGRTIDRIRSVQRARAWRTALDPVVVADIATTPTARLWERRLGDDDAALVRVGVGEIDLDVRYDGRRMHDAGEPITVGVSPVPVTVDLAAGVVGIAGPRSIALGLTRSMAVALAATRSPRDLRFVLCCADGAADEWAWFRWLPHAAGGQAAFALIGNTPDARLARVRELGALLDARSAARGTDSRWRPDSHVVVILDRAREWRTLPGMVGLLERGPALGLFVIAIEDDRARLPEESATEVLVDPADPTMGSVESTTGSVSPVLFDLTTPAHAERIARALSPVMHVGGAGDDTLLPQSVRFVDLIGLDLDDPSGIMASWSFRPRETHAIVGASMDGAFALDIAADGPHGLVAGTTGAGKSEFLQTLVVSLALANRPDALNFVLVDYKGGSAFADCERLPHTVGLVTNLDGRETERALESLDAELKRRERVLNELGAKDADTAWEKDPEAAATRGLARLVLVIDEFAELKSELPEFVSGLVRIARVGRSLGVHLILATQRPSGAITPEMQSNTNLRVALRVTDKGDSTDILGSPEASLISTSTPGRGYARRGPGSAPAAFQTARVAGRRPGVAHTVAAPPAVLPRSWAELGAPVRFPKPPLPSGPIDHDDTDLRAIVGVITEATDRLAITKNPSPWLDPLPAVLSLDDVPGATRASAVILGLEDVPSEQAQRPLSWDIITDSHLGFVGGARSGRTSILRTMVAQLAQRFDPADLHLYAIDYGNAALAPMADLPHCGAVVTPLESGRLNRFMDRLTAEIGQRQQVLVAGRFGDLADQRRAAATSGAPALPYVAVVIDGWERLVASLGDDARELRERLVDLLRAGPAVGVRFVLTADRTFFNDKLSAFLEQKHYLRFTERSDYGMVGLRANALPADVKPGRSYFDFPMREAQLAQLEGGPGGLEQASAFRRRIAKAVEAHQKSDLRLALRPFRVDELPCRLSATEAATLPTSGSDGGTCITLAVGGDKLSQLQVSVDDGLLIAGDRKVGRSSALSYVAEQLAALERATIVVATRDSPLRRRAGRLGLPLFSSAEVDVAGFTTVIASAKADMLHRGYTSICVIVDDVAELRGSQLEQGLMENAHQISFIVAATTEDLGAPNQILVRAKRGQTGLLMSPQMTTHGAHAFNVSIPKEFVGRRQPGRAAFFRDGQYAWVQIPQGDDEHV